MIGGFGRSFQANETLNMATGSNGQNWMVYSVEDC